MGDMLCVVVVVGMLVGFKVKEIMVVGGFVFDEVVVGIIFDCID